MVPTRRGPGRPPEHEGRLARWIKKAGLTRREVAERLGLDRRTVDNLCREARRPSLELAVEIEKLTKGKVPISYLVALPKHSSA
jgi:transcriptional regulator with XRE-family HTH domain